MRRDFSPGLAGLQPAILIFGAAVRPDGTASPTLQLRVAAAARFGEALLVPPLYLPSGAKGLHGEAESTVMARLLREAGVPADRIREEPTGTDTLSSVLALAEMLKDHPGPVWAATSRFHQPRCLLLLRLAGLPARPVPIGGARGAQRWWWRLREVPALPYDALLMLLRRWRQD
nr:YdcF family protein [Siccirubricoccus soli]